MTSFHIKFDNWGQPHDFHGWRVPWFSVYREHDQQPFFVVGARLYYLIGCKILKKMDSEGDARRRKFEQAFLRYTVRRIEQGLQDGIFPTITTLDENQWIEVTEADIPLFERLLQEKTCDYQSQEGRDLLCSAAGKNDPDAIRQIGFRTVAPTSRALCRTCTLPNTDYLCFHLMHPHVRESRQMRVFMGAVCNLGRDEIHKMPFLCHAGGHACWERIIEPQSASPQITTNIGHTMGKSRDIHINIQNIQDSTI